MPKMLNKSLNPEIRTTVKGRRSDWDGVGASGERAEGRWGESERDRPRKNRLEGSLDVAETIPISSGFLCCLSLVSPESRKQRWKVKSRCPGVVESSFRSQVSAPG